MLNALRKGAGTWVAKIFIALLVMSFAIWGVADIFTGFGQNVAAKVGNTEISAFSFDRAYRQELNRIGQQLGRPLSTTEGAQFGIPQQTLGRLVAEAALNERASNLKLSVSDQRLAELIQQDPAFQRPGGGYDRALLAQILRSNGLSEDEYVIERRQLAERQQLAEGLTGRMVAPSAYVEALYQYQNETRDIAFVELTPQDAAVISDPGTQALESYFNANSTAFRAPEYRKIVLLELTPETVARPDDITDEDARAEYERDQERYFTPERRDVRQMVFQSEDEAQAAAQEIDGGKTFDALMAERGLSNSDVSLGLMEQSDFLDETIGQAAFELDAGMTSGVVDGRFGPVILNVTDVKPASTQPFEDVKDEIKATLAAEQAEREVLDLLTEIEDARAGGALLAEISDRFSLPLSEPAAFDQSALDANSNEVSLPEVNGLISGTFDSDIGIENDPLTMGRTGYLWYEVTEVTPARDRTLDEVQPDVIEAWKEDEAQSQLSARAEAIMEELNAGADLETLAEREGLTVGTETGLTRDTAQGAIGRGALPDIFAGPQGHVANVEAQGESGGRLIVVVTSVGTPAYFAEAQDVQALGQQLAQQLQDSMMNQYIADIEQTAGVEVNNAAVAQVIGLNNQQ